MKFIIALALVQISIFTNTVFSAEPTIDVWYRSHQRFGNLGGDPEVVTRVTIHKLTPPEPLPIRPT